MGILRDFVGFFLVIFLAICLIGGFLKSASFAFVKAIEFFDYLNQHPFFQAVFVISVVSFVFALICAISKFFYELEL